MPSLFTLLWLPIITVCLLLTLPPLTSSNLSTDRRREVIRARHGAVATDDGRCSVIGRDVLREGGHAVDAAVAAAFCLGVVSPASSGIGGGAFALVRSVDGRTRAFDMRETAPKLASPNMYGGNAALKAKGPLSIAVPGQIAGLYRAWRQYGKLPWKRLVNPAENLARKGFKISPYLGMQIAAIQQGIMADKGLRHIYTTTTTTTSSNGRSRPRRLLLKAGDLCYNKKLANTLRAVSRYGWKVFYNGSVGLSLVEDVRKAGGILTMEDLQGYRVKLRKPLSAHILGLDIFGMPPPSSGGAAMMLILNIIEKYGVPKGDIGALGIHREVEALKHAFAVRMNLGDPDFVDVTQVVQDMISPKFAAKLKKTIYDNMTFAPSHYGDRWNPIEDHGTSHLSVVDSERNAVAMTSTVNSFFGAQFMSPGTGIVLNNEMDDFSMPANVSANVPPPAPPNFIRPGKRPLSSMSPTIALKEGKLKAVVGASGGANIIGGTTEVLLNHFVKGLDPLSSVMAPRYYHQLIPNVLQYENWTTVIGDHFEVPAETRAVLAKKGHVLQGVATATVCQFIVQEVEEGSKKVGGLVAVSDPRKGGFPSGF